MSSKSCRAYSTSRLSLISPSFVVGECGSSTSDWLQSRLLNDTQRRTQRFDVCWISCQKNMQVACVMFALKPDEDWPERSSSLKI